ncbi:MAG: hypothetical protein A2X32_08820 [Elusimicrobia bacterium GWC2_64_44]|nr:MAG: hypothetical protein A2X32_08820 [Elusimicrobia bacterium GWC2_64_44]
MKLPLVFLFATLLPATTFSQTPGVIDLKPESKAIRDLSPKAIEEFKERDKVAVKLTNGASRESLTKKELALLNKYGWGEEGSIWDIMDQGCSWYCGGGPRKIAASSFLAPAGDTSYDAEKAHDNSLKAAWVEGVPGYGKGQYLEYFFENKSPRLTNVLIYNGYVKSEKTWKENSRVKQLLLSVNGAPYARLHLADTRDLQNFSLPGPLGRRADGKELELRFEIVEVYKGLLHADTALTELYFDGIDVH